MAHPHSHHRRDERSRARDCPGPAVRSEYLNAARTGLHHVGSRYDLVLKLCETPELVRGYEQVKLRNNERYRAASRCLLEQVLEDCCEGSPAEISEQRRSQRPKEPRCKQSKSRLIAYEEWGDLRGRPMFQLHGTPGSRLSRHLDATLYPSRHLHVVTIDRPGYGGSTALPGRRVSHGAHDVAAFADELGLDRFFVVGGSGGGPHALACAAELGDRVLGCAPVASAAPLIPAEIDGLLGINHKGFQVLADSGR
jgi:alpha/beta hydrolase fold